MTKVRKSIVAIVMAALMAGLVTSVDVKNTLSADAAEAFSMEEVLVPVWEGDISYMESVLPVAEQDGSVAPISLLYPISEIVEVKSASLQITYTAGTDYAVENGKLVIPANSRIPVLSYNDFHPQAGSPDAVEGFEDRNGGYVLWKEGSWYHSRQIVVTYTHAEDYEGYVPEGKGALLPMTQEKLKGDTLNVLVYGDSISTGGNSSGHEAIHTAPYMPIYPLMFAEGLKQIYGVETVNVYNASVGGTDSAWGLSNLRGGVLDKYNDIDLAILAFGMNDTTRDPDSFASNMQRMARGLKSKYSDVEVMIISTMLPNYDAYKFYGQQVNFHDALMEYEKEGIAIVNVTGVHAGLLEYKAYADMTGNNINHANDYLARVYAQTLLKTLEVSDYGQPEPEVPDTPITSEDPETPEESGSSELPESNDSNESIDSPVQSETPAQSDTAEPSPSSSTEKSGCGSMAGLGGAIVLLSAAAFAVEQRKRK